MPAATPAFGPRDEQRLLLHVIDLDPTNAPERVADLKAMKERDPEAYAGMLLRFMAEHADDGDD